MHTSLKDDGQMSRDGFYVLASPAEDVTWEEDSVPLVFFLVQLVGSLLIARYNILPDFFIAESGVEKSLERPFM